MSQAHGLSDDQVSQELRKMTLFIKQEAEEKAREITIKANEEFSIEKAKLVREETDAIDAQYEKKFKQASLSQQIAQSTISNKTRLRVLAARQELIDSIFDTAQDQLVEVVKQDKNRYQETLENLILEGFYALNEGSLQIRARKEDYDVVKKAISKAEKEFKKALDQDIKASIDEENALPSESAGGVVIVGGNGKIDIDNSLEARLNILKDSALPTLRRALFGQNPNRKFFD